MTNFFTYDMNRPLHVFDADKVKGDLRVHRAKGGETLLALDEKTYTAAPGHTLISDENGAESLAGNRMGGRRVAAAPMRTVNVYVESWLLDPATWPTRGR